MTVLNKPSLEELMKMPKLYGTEKIPPKNKIIYEHFFIFGSDWYIAEFDGTDTMFGYAILNTDHHNAEWGHVSFKELSDVNVHGFEVERDIYWIPKEARNIEKIVLSGGANY